MYRFFYYNKKENILFDSNGVLIIDIFEWVTPNDLCLFKKSKKSKTVHVNEHLKIILVYPVWAIYERRSFYTQVKEEFIKHCESRYNSKYGVTKSEWVDVLLIDYERTSA